MAACTRGVSVGKWCALVGGAVVAGAGLRLRSWPRLALVLAGGAAVYWAARGVTPHRITEKLEVFGAGVTSGIYDDVAQAAKEERSPAGMLIGDPDALVDEASDDSFPCSDPPSFTAR
jgi:hypothetical protein